MKNIILSLFVAIVLFSCSKDKKEAMLVIGEIKGLKKGTLYLQKMRDTLLISVDSVSLDGINTFSLTDVIESSELYFLSLDKSSDKRIPFFGEKGTITINTKLDKFRYSATVNGLTNQQLLDEYKEMMGKFSDRRLDYIKDEFDAKKNNDSIKIDSIRNLMKNLIKRRYYYTANFAVNHADTEIAPYLALTELFDANITLLDTVNNTLTPEIKASKYGKALEKFIADIKSKE